MPSSHSEILTGVLATFGFENSYNDHFVLLDSATKECSFLSAEVMKSEGDLYRFVNIPPMKIIQGYLCRRPVEAVYSLEDC